MLSNKAIQQIAMATQYLEYAKVYAMQDNDQTLYTFTEYMLPLLKQASTLNTATILDTVASRLDYLQLDLSSLAKQIIKDEETNAVN